MLTDAERVSTNPLDHFYAGLCFSPDNKKLYVSRQGFRPFSAGGGLLSQLYQYDLAAGSPDAIRASRLLIFQDTTINFLGDPQLAIDGKIYFSGARGRAIRDTTLNVINCPNNRGAACDIRLGVVDLRGRAASILLPTQNQALFRNANQVQASANPGLVCRGDTARLVAYGGGTTTVRWSPATGLSSDTVQAPLAFPSVTTTYTVIAQRRCGPPDTARVTLVVGAPVALLNAGRDTTVSAGAVVRLGGAFTPGGAYQWAPGRYLSSARAPRPLLRVPNARRDTVLTYVLTASCAALRPDTVRLTVQARPVAVPGPDRAACPADTLRLGGAPARTGTTYRWTTAGRPLIGQLLDAPTAARPLLRLPARPPGQDTVYVFTLTASRPGTAARDSMATVTVRVAGPPPAPRLLAVSVDTTDQNRVVLTYDVPRPAAFPGGVLVPEVRPAGGVFVAQPPVPVAGSAVTLPAAGPGAAYRLRGTGLCPPEVVSTTHRPLTLTGLLTDSLGGAALRWSAYVGWADAQPSGPVRYTLLAQTGDEGAAGAFAPVGVAGTDTVRQQPAPATGRRTTYRVRATAPDGRRADSNPLTFTTAPRLLAYNILTPDGDGRNDAFVVENLVRYPGTGLRVYNRWGGEVFRADDYRNDWRAEGLAAGLYYWRLTAPGAPQLYKGWVQVVR